MARIPREQVIGTMAEVFGTEAAESALASALAEAGVADRPSFDAEEVALVGQALMGRAGRLAAEQQKG